LMKMKEINKNRLTARILIISFILVFLITSSNSFAINFGSVVKNNMLTIRQGESGEFVILVWNLEKPSLPVTIKTASSPDGWLVRITPENFVLNYALDPAPYEKWEYLMEKDYLIKTFPVKVSVTVPENVESKNYNILLNAVAGNPSNGISFLIERNFLLTVNADDGSGSKVLESTKKNSESMMDSIKNFLTNTFTSNEAQTDAEKSQSSTDKSPLTGEFVSLASSKYLFYVISSICILVVSLIIYKYAYKV